MSSNTVIPVSLDDLFQSGDSGSLDNPIGDNFYGFNHRLRPSVVPINKDLYGLTFFVRPQLNLQKDNIRNARIFTPLLTNNGTSIQTIARCYLDPRLSYGYPQNENVVHCPFVDPQQAFIPLLTNHLKSISGWPDIIVPTMTSKEGAYQEAHAMVDGITANYTAYDIEATFRNSKGDPIMLLFYIWEHYMSMVYESTLVPYPDMIVENEIDYNTRIYRLVLDPTKKKVQKIAATGVSFPTSLPLGGFFDFSSDKPINDNNNDITIRFKCLGAQYQDDILIYEFNQTVAVFNQSMEPRSIQKEMIMIPDTLKGLFNNRGYPRINPETYELEWWVSRDVYVKKLQGLDTFNNALKT